ncbi:editing domain of threonyl-tRNA synthetase [Sulfobacillus thermosulfidooxidans DSM 9293]|uniref:Editing domain of threonyl-tRNA synthetase n=1 Tax=Sulfobacillus thermosulfidooxidans (strain DSM 9293 / VKM B-1269 / AT-1) TaxID=929705 RepID=A0A1W1WL92_SULTA|nr:threonyl-tRNA synthetase editing domain-containing protein [Sulfobacillus thermosulfidooxidans]SMC06493.1 editing domain of threonyl-tRNA synthetase [Sulfobacillus thermosulfidooxidans DSM 9293]
MKALYFYTQAFSALPALPAIRSASENPRAISVKYATVIYLALEQGDTDQSVSGCLLDFIRERRRNGLPVVIHSFNHLSDCPMPLNPAKKLYERLPQQLVATGIEHILSTTFGWIYEISMTDVGERGSKGRILCAQIAERPSR